MFTFILHIQVMSNTCHETCKRSQTSNQQCRQWSTTHEIDQRQRWRERASRWRATFNTEIGIPLRFLVIARNCSTISVLYVGLSYPFRVIANSSVTHELRLHQPQRANRFCRWTWTLRGRRLLKYRVFGRNEIFLGEMNLWCYTLVCEITFGFGHCPCIKNPREYVNYLMEW